MARLNRPRLRAIWNALFTHEGAPAKRIDAEQQLRRSVLACLLWENTFYEGGVEIADRIASLADEVAPETVAALAVEARDVQHLRHVPLWLVRQLARTKSTGSLYLLNGKTKKVVFFSSGEPEKRFSGGLR